MSIDDKTATTEPRPKGIECEHYRAMADSKTCQRYVATGFCSLAIGDGGTCTEWTKRNEGKEPKLKRDDELDELLAEAGAYQEPEPDPLDEIIPVGDLVEKGTPHSDDPWPLVPTFTDEDIDRFKKNGLEYRFVSKLDSIGELWLVPSYTDEGKKEITLEDLNKLTMVANAFPSSRMVAFRKLTKALEAE